MKKYKKNKQKIFIIIGMLFFLIPLKLLSQWRRSADNNGFYTDANWINIDNNKNSNSPQIDFGSKPPNYYRLSYIRSLSHFEISQETWIENKVVAFYGSSNSKAYLIAKEDKSKLSSLYPLEIHLGTDVNGENGVLVARFDALGRLGLGTESPTLNLEVIAPGWQYPKLGIGRKNAPWDHFYVTTEGESSIFRAGGAEHGIDFQVGLSTQGTFDDASQNYTSKFQIYPNKVETKTKEVTLNYGGNNDLTKVSINTDAKVDNSTLTIAGSTYIGPQAEKASTGSLDKFKEEYLNDYNLWVEDGIVTEDITIVEVNEWKDIVFSNDYKLKPLKEVESFIRINKHLPGVKSETEVKKEGYSIQEMDVTLLKKVEELTLYTIKQEKKIKDLEKKLNKYKNLEGEISKLKELVLSSQK